jgi:methyl-accepting chemotaxis protein
VAGTAASAQSNGATIARLEAIAAQVAEAASTQRAISHDIAQSAAHAAQEAGAVWSSLASVRLAAEMNDAEAEKLQTASATHSREAAALAEFISSYIANVQAA